MTRPTDFAGLLTRLLEARVAFILVGGIAGNVHGAARATYDIDVVYARDEANLRHLAEALGPVHPYLRGAPPGLPFRLEPQTLRAGLNFTLSTDLGDIDLLGEIIGGGTYEDLLPSTIEIAVFGSSCRCVTLDTLIRLKRAAGRPRDLDALAELEALADESKRQ